MAVDNSLQSLLASLTASVQSAADAVPTENIIPPKEGISLLDVKNEILLSYLQNLVFLILLKIRSQAGSQTKTTADDVLSQDDVVQKLVELRLYLEKGVRPLENRLKYNIDKIIRAADDAARRASQKESKVSTDKEPKSRAQNHDGGDSDSSQSAQADSEDEDEMSYAPNKARLARSRPEQTEEQSQVTKKDGIYRPPKITPMAMPTTESREARRERRPGKSATLDEFIATEMSSAPLAQPSIGSTITHGGRHTKSDKERREEAERREYEEANFTRLAPDSKKEKAKKKARQQSGAFGGEEWRSLGAGIDRIEQLTQKKGGSLGSLEKSRKRPTSDGPRGAGSAAGDAFEKRRRIVSRYRK